MKLFKRGLLTLLLCAVLAPTYAAEESYGNYATRYYGSANGDNVLLFTTTDVVKWDRCMLMSTTGAVDVEGSIDGSTFNTAPLALQDMGAAALDNVLVTAALRMYVVLGRYRLIRVRQNGATAAAASMLCWRNSN